MVAPAVRVRLARRVRMPLWRVPPVRAVVWAAMVARVVSAVSVGSGVRPVVSRAMWVRRALMVMAVSVA
jgi:hypothetical protein